MKFYVSKERQRETGLTGIYVTPKRSFIILTSPQGDGDIWKITYDLK